MSKILGWKSALVLGLAVSYPLSAAALGSVTAGDVTFAYTDFTNGASNTTNVNFTGASPSDMAYESWWFYRVSGGTRESAFAAPDIELYGGSVGVLDWANPTGLGLFDASLSVEVIDPGTGGNLFQNMRIRNTSGTALTISVFHYSDFDLNGSSGGDRAALGTNPDGLQINQTEGAQVARIVGYGANNYRVSRYAQILADLTDTGIDDFSNNGLPLNNQDVTIGFQWNVTIAAGSYADFMTQFSSNAVLLPPSATVLPVPEPATATLVALGLAGLATPGAARRARAA